MSLALGALLIYLRSPFRFIGEFAQGGVMRTF